LRSTHKVKDTNKLAAKTRNGEEEKKAKKKEHAATCCNPIINNIYIYIIYRQGENI
jgi:hypothetical protein